MTQTCRPAKCVEAVRLALLDQCTLEPLPGVQNGAVFGCVIDPDWDPDIEEGAESTVKDDCGRLCLQDTRCDITKQWNLQFKVAYPSPELISLLTGDPLMVDTTDPENPLSVGVRHLSRGCSPYLFVEMFERSDDCGDDGSPLYYRHVFPASRLKWTGNEREGVFRLIQIEGKTRSVLTDAIGTGPYLDIPPDATLSTGPTERVDYLWFEDTTTLPDLECGFVEVPEPITIASVVSACPEGPGVHITGENLDLVTGWFEIDVTCGILRGYVSGSTLPTGSPATSESPTDVVFVDESYDASCPGCVASAIRIFDGDGNQVGSQIDFDVPFDICCAPGFTAPEAHDTNEFLSSGASAVVADSTGRYLVAHTLENGGNIKAGVWRFLEDGTIDATWGTAGVVLLGSGTTREHVVGMAVGPADELYVQLDTNRLSGPPTPVKVAKIDSTGALVGAFGTGGYATIEASGDCVPAGIVLQTAQSRLLVAWTDNASAGHITAVATADGSLTGDQIDSAYMVRAFGVDPSDPDHVIAASWDANTVTDHYVTDGDLATSSATDTLVHDGSVFSWTPNVQDLPVGMHVLAGGACYVGATSSDNSKWTIAKFTAAPALDGAFGVGGVLVDADGADQGLTHVSCITVLAGSNVLAGGLRQQTDKLPISIRCTSAGVLVGSYGTGGVETYTAADVLNDATFNAVLLEEGDARAVWAGSLIYAAGDHKSAMILRSHLASGAIDHSFGTGVTP